MMRLLVTFPFSIFPLTSGGALRGYHLLREFARHFDTYAIVYDSRREIEESIRSELRSELVGLHVEEIDLNAQRGGLLQKMTNRWKTYQCCGSFRVPANSTTLAISKVLYQVLPKWQPHVSVLTDLEGWVCGKLIGRISPSTLRVLDLYNVEHVLRAQKLALANRPVETDREYLRLRQSEKQLHLAADGFFACSDVDKQLLSTLNEGRMRAHTVPNGVAYEKAPFDQNTKKHLSNKILFCGTLSYQANVDGLNWFLDEVWPLVLLKRSDLVLQIVGRGYRECNFPGLDTKPSVELIGEVDDLRPYYDDASVSICPLRVGSGTRLKILESLSFGIPTISTTIGCEGIDVRDGETILIRDEPDKFATAVIDLLSDKDHYHATRTAGNQLARIKYDWRAIGNDAAETIQTWASQG